MNYRLVIFDADGTLTPLRGSPVGAFTYQLLPGVAEKCSELAANDVQMAIASNQSPEREQSDILEQMTWTAKQLGIPWRLTWWMRDRACQKPAPLMLNCIMTLAGVAPENSLFVGDWDTDRQSAENAGIDFQWAQDFFGGEQ